jgi:Domain of unknown function (DUF1707)
VPMLTPDDVRASNEDRDSTVAILCDAYAVGRLDLADIRDRAGAAYRARTGGDLRRLVADLPPPGVPGARPVSTGGRSGVALCRQQALQTTFLLLAVLGWLAMAMGAFMTAAAVAYAAVTLLFVSMLVFVAVGLVATFRVPAPGGRRRSIWFRRHLC